MPFAVGDRVVCTHDVGRFGELLQGQEYRVSWVSPGNLALRVENSGVVFRSNRFEHAVTPVAVAAPPPAPAPERLNYYTTDEFVGCCGVNILFFNNLEVNQRSLENWKEETFGEDNYEEGEYESVPMYIGVLNQHQHTDAAQRALLEAEFRFLTTSRANGGGVLYTYCYNRNNDVPEFTPIEVQRRFEQ